jgi:cell division protease FtsH
MQLPERDKLSMSLEQMTSCLAIMMGGRVAEKLMFGHEKVTSGAASDIEQATRLARMMVNCCGLSEELGTVSYGENQDEVFLGMSVSRTQNASEATFQKIDIEIKRLLPEKRADALAKGLLEFETLTGEEIGAFSRVSIRTVTCNHSRRRRGHLTQVNQRTSSSD